MRKIKIEKNFYKMYHIHHIKMENVYNEWSGINGMRQRVIGETGFAPFTGVGISIKGSTAILQSVDDTYYYDDNLDNMDNPKYTLFGPNGDQSVDERRFNEPLLNPDKTTDIYLYRRIPNRRKPNKTSLYIWYGKYEIVGRNTQPHRGRDGTMRNIIVLSLRRIIPRL
jgi:hypothetical protein